MGLRKTERPLVERPFCFLQNRLRGFFHASDQLHALQAGMAVPADDDVVVDGDAERAGDLDHRLRHLDVGPRRRGVARRMVVDHPF